MRAYVLEPLKRFAREEDGTTAIEYALIASGISIAIVGSLNAVGSTLITNYYDRITEGFAEAGMTGGGGGGEEDGGN